MSFVGSKSFLSLAKGMPVSSCATSITGRDSLYAFLAIAAAFWYQITGFSAVTKIGFFDKDSSIWL